MAEQSRKVDHIYSDEALDTIIEISDLSLEYDFRPKIENLNTYKEYMKERGLWSDKLEEETNLYLKFYND